MDATAMPHSNPKLKKKAKIKGCYECARRRIDCDRQQPVCLKCDSKGITCSGLSIRYRFTGDFATRGKLVGRPVPNILSYKNTQCPSPSPSYRNEGDRLVTLKLSPPPVHEHHIQCSHQTKHTSKRLSLASCPTGVNSHTGKHDLNVHWVERNLDHIDGRSRWYLHYCMYTPIQHCVCVNIEAYFLTVAEHIAPLTAVIALGFNGYRDVVLPTAEKDALVRKAIVAVADQHLSLQFGMVENEQMYESLIADLISRSKDFSPGEDETAMTTLLLLHLREMVSGSGNFKLLFGPLRSVVRSMGPQTQYPRSQLKEFVQIQILRVCLFGEALFDETNGANFLVVHGEDCLEFLRYCQAFHPEHHQLMSYLFQIFKLACDLYIQRATLNPQPQDTVNQVEQFKSLALQVALYDNTTGRHLLVWSYFIVAAESSTPDHRSFFLDKLQVLHNQTKCRNILRAMDQLQRIWAMQSTTRWTSLLGGPSQTLIM